MPLMPGVTEPGFLEQESGVGGICPQLAPHLCHGHVAVPVCLRLPAPCLLRGRKGGHRPVGPCHGPALPPHLGSRPQGSPTQCGPHKEGCRSEAPTCSGIPAWPEGLALDAGLTSPCHLQEAGSTVRGSLSGVEGHRSLLGSSASAPDPESPPHLPRQPGETSQGESHGSRSRTPSTPPDGRRWSSLLRQGSSGCAQQGPGQAIPGGLGRLRSRGAIMGPRELHCGPRPHHRLLRSSPSLAWSVRSRP